MLVTINRQPGANIIGTVDRIREAIPYVKAAIPQSIDLTVTQDQTVTIRASVHDVEITLLIAVVPGDSGGVRFSAQRAHHADPQRSGAGVADRNLRRDVPALDIAWTI